MEQVLEIAITTKNLTRDFKPTRAVDALSFEVPSGTIFGFLGPNGAGKTTTIHLLLGILEPTSGKASVLGFDCETQGHAIRQNTGVLLEHHGLYERLSAEANLEFYARIWKLKHKERNARIQELLSSLELWERRKDNVENWSHGMKKKLAIARALIHHPLLLFLDEPTNGLDPIAADALRSNLMDLVLREHITVFLTTHNLNEAEKLCQQVGVIRQGKLLAVGSVETLKSKSEALLVEIDGKGFDDRIVSLVQQRKEVNNIEQEKGKLLVRLNKNYSIAPIIQILVEQGVAIEEVRKRRANLEDVFIQLVKEEQS